MEAEVRYEQPLYNFEGTFTDPDTGHGILRLYAADLREVPVGHMWTVNDQDRYPNGQMYWTNTVKKVYEDLHGVLLIECDGETGKVRAIWCELNR